MIRRTQKEKNDLCEDIDASITKNHGVRCFEDGDKDNLMVRNVFYLHICDVINIIITRTSGEAIDVVVPTDLLTIIPKDMTNDFELKFLREENRAFLMEHADFLYYCYAYIGNHSFIPIRTKLNDNSSIFVESPFL